MSCISQLADPSSQGLEEKKGAGTFVYFFGTRRCAWVKAEFCLPFYENIHLVRNPPARVMWGVSW
eukprot:3657967-Rhodomonas_salina.4